MRWMGKRISEKQKAFCDYYIETGNATEAARKAGYSNKYTNTNANKLLQNTTVKAYLDERLKQIEDKRIAKPVEVLQYLTKVMRGEEKDQFDLDAPLNERTKAAELLGKRYRLFTEKIEADVNQTVVFEGEKDLED